MEAAAPLLGCVDGTVQAVLPLLGVDTDKSDAALAAAEKSVASPRVALVHPVTPATVGWLC